MISATIILKDGKTECRTMAKCDYCGMGYTWTAENVSTHVRTTQAIRIVRRKGWKIGKKHICKNCTSKG